MKIRKKKEIEDKIDEIYQLIKQDKLDTARGIVINDALAWTLGEDYLDEPPYILEKGDEKDDDTRHNQ